MELSPLFPLISGAAALGVFEGPIKSINDCWYYHIGYLTSQNARKRRIQEDLYVEKFRNECTECIQKINQKNIQEPRKSIMHRSMEVTLYYLEEDELRKMFAQLLAASIDKSKNGIAHNAFVEIIKQMSSLDAENLKLFKSSSVFPIVKIYSSLKGQPQAFSVLEDNIFIDNKTCSDFRQLASSLSNLKRLGLIEITFNSWEDPSKRFTDTNIYESFKKTSIFKELIETHQCENLEIGIYPGTVEITPLGKDFITVCL